ncbi:HsdM family class I SAM-dependent methyltransferase [Alloalcanivorax gelatiniphagus]|uniref:site-specific DNA-methyltransferase (adenine-specific) n=1 Tax=Alloalcanivorax gelatiniphagus TaxID=1194167 RepID=A0ABY2XQL8_9GAMM|nr:N-6 DNA methylase [Alloalcanivorax gelatiniphagus]TMW15201.1 SAM-dependent methyltransferase [Alloalcanivorax gelatiniphagus]
MTLDEPCASQASVDWLLPAGDGRRVSHIDGLVTVSDYDYRGRPPEEVSIMEKARSYGARAVFFEASRHGRAPVAQAFIFDSGDDPDDPGFAELHKRLWSWGAIPLVYRVLPGSVQLFRCAHAPDFVGKDGTQICEPVRTLAIGAQIAAEDAWWDANRIRNGTIWDDPEVCKLMLSAQKAAHRTLVEAVRALAASLSERKLLAPQLSRKLLILSLLIAYLEERSVLLPSDFEKVRRGTKRFFEVLGDGQALSRLLIALEERFNGHVFRLTKEEHLSLVNNTELVNYARLVEGYEDGNGQMSLWRLYSFRDLPIELISNIYQLFVKDASSSIYTPPALVRLMLEETLSWDKLDELTAGEGVILDPACGSGVFLVEAYKRLVLHWRWRNDWVRPSINDLRSLLERVHGIDVEDGAIELAAFSLCLSLCDALQPEEIRSSVKLFPPLADVTLHHSCFFDAKQMELVKSPISVIVGNPPFASSLTTEGARRCYDSYKKKHDYLADKQLAYLFLHEAMEMLEENGVLAMVEPAGFLYNQHSLSFRRSFLSRWKTREILDFVSVRGLFKKGGADPKIIIVIAEATSSKPDGRVLHAVFRRNGRATAEQGFDIDYYDLHWLRNADATCSQDIWRANLLGGNRVHEMITRLRGYKTLKEFATERGWDFGEGYFGGQKNSSDNTQHLIGKPLLPTQALGAKGIDRSLIIDVPDDPVKDPKSANRFAAPLLLIKEHENLYFDVWKDGYLTYKNEIVGFSAPDDPEELSQIANWLKKESVALRAYVAGISSRLFTQRATSIFNADIFSIPYPEERDLDLSANEKIIAEDIVSFQRDFIRLGTSSPAMQKVSTDALEAFDRVLVSQINGVYGEGQLQALPSEQWPGAICKAYAFGDGTVDWSGAGELRDRLDALLYQRRGSSLTVTRITRLYDKNFLFLLKPDRHRFWMRSIALRDADDVLADLREQGF